MWSLNIPPRKLFEWFRRLQLWAAGDWQLHHNNEPACASRLMQRFLAKHPVTQMTQLPCNPDLVPCDFWLFPKLKSPLKGKRFQDLNESQENTMGQLMATARTGWGPEVPTLKGIVMSLSHVQYFLYLVSSSININVYFSYGMAEYFLDRLYKTSFIDYIVLQL